MATIHPEIVIPPNSPEASHRSHLEKTRPLSGTPSPPKISTLAPPDRQTPTFASLSSSPSGSPALLDYPDSPDLNQLITDVVGEKRTYESDPHQGSRARKRMRYEWASHDSHASSDSHDSVERQLTQTPEMDADADAFGEPDDEYISTNPSSQSQKSESLAQATRSPDLYAGEIDWSSGERASHFATTGTSSPADSSSQSQMSLPLNISTQTPAIPSAPSPHPLVQRQAWYQAPRPRKKSGASKSSKTDATRAGSSSTTQSQQRVTRRAPGRTELTSAPSAKSFRSGSLKISPAKDLATTQPSNPADAGACHSVDSQSNHDDWAESQDSSQPFSYVPQTQAPYQSQSLSQF